MKAANRFENRQRFHQLTNLEILEHCHHAKSGRPRHSLNQLNAIITLRAFLVPHKEAIATEQQRSGRFILGTNVLDTQELSNDDVLRDYIAQQSTERGFRFLKDPLFFTSSVFLN